MIKLYKMDSNRNIRFWTAEIEDDLLVVKHGILRGTIQTKTETIVPKAGRTMGEQALLQAASRCKKKRDAGYTNDIEDAKKGIIRNQLGFRMPMLAQKMPDYRKPIRDWFVQYKYDGHRCLVHNDGFELIAYSKTGTPITTIGHILKHINIPVGETLDGELYVHGLSLQKIASLVKRKQEGSENLQYMVYDTIRNAPYKVRYDFIKACVANLVVPTWFEGNYDDVAFREARAAGYEGLMVRHGDFGYQDAKRSESLLKVKKQTGEGNVCEEEYPVIDIVPSKDGWAILVCEMPDGQEFRVSAPGSMTSKTYVMENKDKFIGESVTVEYPNLTDKGIPFQPVAARWFTEL